MKASVGVTIPGDQKEEVEKPTEQAFKSAFLKMFDNVEVKYFEFHKLLMAGESSSSSWNNAGKR